METSRKLLFSEPFYSENGIWCDLHPELDPAQWARLCRFIGNLSPSQFDRVEKMVMESQGSTGNISFKAWESKHLPLVCLDPAGIRQDRCSP